MSDLQKRLTTGQIHKLDLVGIHSLYDLITTIPSKLIRVEPLQSHSNMKEGESGDIRFLCELKLVAITQRSGRGRFLVLDFEGDTSGFGTLRAYLFSITKFTLKSLEIGQTYQLLMKLHDSLWNIEKYAIVRSDKIPELVLGRSLIQSYIMPVYPTKQAVTNYVWLSAFQRLKPEDFILDLGGLVPPGSIIPQHIDLRQIHKPHSLESYKKTLQEWIEFKVFLKLCAIRYIENQNYTKKAIQSELHQPFIKKLSETLPFQLSSSQKIVIWDILQEISG